MVVPPDPLTAPPWPPREAARRWAFFLDIDGTLLEYADRPAAVRIEGELASTLARLHQAAGGAVALISGRAVSDVDTLFAPLVMPDSMAPSGGAPTAPTTGTRRWPTRCGRRPRRSRASAPGTPVCSSKTRA
jgi:trehalose 6-phosphate phosphatase